MWRLGLRNASPTWARLLLDRRRGRARRRLRRRQPGAHRTPPARPRRAVPDHHLGRGPRRAGAPSPSTPRWASRCSATPSAVRPRPKIRRVPGVGAGASRSRAARGCSSARRRARSCRPDPPCSSPGRRPRSTPTRCAPGVLPAPTTRSSSTSPPPRAQHRPRPDGRRPGRRSRHVPRRRPRRFGDGDGPPNSTLALVRPAGRPAPPARWAAGRRTPTSGPPTATSTSKRAGRLTAALGAQVRRVARAATSPPPAPPPPRPRSATCRPCCWRWPPRRCSSARS